MKRLYIIFIISCCIIQTGMSQKVGTWKDYFAYYNTTAVAEGNNYVFAIADSSLYSFGKEDNSINCYSKQTGLSDNKITGIAYNSNQNILVMTYKNGNIDLWGENGIRNINSIKESNLPDKGINSIYNYNEFAYLCTQFGIVVLDTKKNEIKETYRFNKVTSSVLIFENKIYAVVDSIIMTAPIDVNLIDTNNWTKYITNNADIDNGKTLSICLFQNSFCFHIYQKGIYYQSGSGYKQLLAHNSLRTFKVEADKLITFSTAAPNADLYIYSSFTERVTIKINSIYDVSSLKDKNTLWFAAAGEGILGIKENGSGQYETIIRNLSIDGPKRNFNDFQMMHNGKLYIAGGGRWTDRYTRAGTIMIYNPEENKWNNIPDVNGFQDATSIAVNPDDETHFFVSTWHRGIYEFKDNELVKRHDLTNSALETALPDYQPSEYVRIEGLCFDKDKNLWMTNTANANVIKVLKPDGTWAKIDYPDLRNPTLADKILITSNGDKWVNLVRGNRTGLFVFNENGTLDDVSDDKYRYFSSLSYNNTTIGENYYFCITQDLNNDLWIGTDRGPIILYNPMRALSSPDANISFTRIVRTAEDGNPMYFLGDEQVNAIAVDAGNRKWIGTTSSGVFLISEDGRETLEHFTTDNSYLPNNNVKSIAIDHRTGEVFFGTDAGLVSYFGEAKGGSPSYNDVYAYPNPVRPDFNDKVIITGLMDNSSVKITDVRGNLIYQTRSVGGQASWDCRNKSGRRVASGVYLVMAATPEGKEGVVTKIAVIK